MGLESFILDFVAAKDKADHLQKAVEGLKDIVPVLGREFEYIIVREMYLIELKIISRRNVSIRTAFSSSEDVLNEIQQISQKLNSIVGGGLVEHRTALTISLKEEHSQKILIEIFRDQKEVFLDHIADLDGLSIRVTDIWNYIRENEIKPRNPQKETDLGERKKQLLNRIERIISDARSNEMNKYSKTAIARLFQYKNLPAPQHLDSLDNMIPLINLLRADNSVFILKMDGERKIEKGEKIYTVIISSTGGLRSSFRDDSNDMFGSIRKVFIEYAERHWGFTV